VRYKNICNIVGAPGPPPDLLTPVISTGFPTVSSALPTKGFDTRTYRLAEHQLQIYVKPRVKAGREHVSQYSKGKAIPLQAWTGP
jgi:hypothetical protein